MEIDRKDTNPPIILPGPDGAHTLTRLSDPNYTLTRPLHPVYIDELPDGRIQVSDEYSNVSAIGSKPEVFEAYQKRLVRAAELSPEAIPQIVRKPIRR